MSPRVTHCDIRGITAGIWIKSDGNPWVDNTYFTASGNAAGTSAVRSSNNSDGFFVNCELYGVNYYTKYCHKNEGSATPSYHYYGSARNIFRGDNLAAYSSSIYVSGGIPYFYNGKNSILPRTYLYQFYNTTGSLINAQGNFWGGGAPLVYGQVDYFNYLTTSPNPVGPNWSLPKVNNEDSGEGNDLADAWESYFERDFSNAKELAMNVFQNKITTEQSSEALFLYMKSALKEGNLEKEANALLAYTNNSNIHSSAKYESLRWLAKLAVSNKDFQKAKDYVLSIPKASLYGRELLLDLAVEILERWGDMDEATDVLDKLIERYPDKETIAERDLILNSYEEYNSRLGKESKSNIESNIEVAVNSFQLFDAYPNPFNPSTTINYALPYQSSVEVVIYDIIGRVVKSFDISSQSAGYQSIFWDGRNEIGNSVASGIYLYRISIKSLENNETFVKTAKLMMLK